MEHDFRKTLLSLILVCLLVLSGCAQNEPGVQAFSQPRPEPSISTRGIIQAAVLYQDGAEGTWKDTLSYLSQSTMVNLEAQAIQPTDTMDFSQYHILYLDASVASSPEIERICKNICAFAADGGTVVVDNALANLFPKEFLGAVRFEKVQACPVELTAPDLGADLKEIQTILQDFASLYASYADYETLSQQDYGYAMTCGTATPLVLWEGKGLYTVNVWEKGMVFLTNPLLPNFYNASGFDMDADEGQLNFVSTTASCNQLLTNAFAEYVSKQQFGYAISRVFGSNAAPSMAWELHYEEATGIANDSMQIFSDLCREYLQIPSFTFIRNSYWWYLRSESVTYYLNEGSSAKPEYSLDLYENAYSSGTHVAKNGKWLTLADIKDGGSYFNDYPEFAHRAYPEAIDYDQDAALDLFCGSRDGYVYYFPGTGYSDRMHTASGKLLTDFEGNYIYTGSYSAPALTDVDGDGYLDLIVGTGTGSMNWYQGNGTLQFAPMGVFLQTDVIGQVFPALGDLNGDGIPDLALGSNQKILLIYYGSKDASGRLSYTHANMDSLSYLTGNAELGTWLAPEICDYNDDGSIDILVGTFDGYIALLEKHDSGYAFSGYLTTSEPNYKGSNYIKTGHNCVPDFVDVNGDGLGDLLCGSLEYGMAYPIDSPYFPYAEKVQEQIDYAKEHLFYVGPHFYTNAYASPERELFELQAHRDALEHYGLDVDGTGVNQHTWYISSNSQDQTMNSIWNSGLLWQSGFGSAGGTYRIPAQATENVIPLPFFLESEGKKTLLVQNCPAVGYLEPSYHAITARYGAPVCMYYHCDFVYENDEDARSKLTLLSDYWWQYGYNFVREDQLMRATAAAYNLRADISGSLETGLTIAPDMDTTDGALYSEIYQKAAGIKLSFHQDLDPNAYACDANVLRREANALYLSLDRAVTVTLDDGADTRLERVNLPAEIILSNNSARVAFLDGGMMQILVAGNATTEDAGWIVTAREGKTIFTKYGEADSLTINFES